MDSQNNLKTKISWHRPFKLISWGRKVAKGLPCQLLRDKQHKIKGPFVWRRTEHVDKGKNGQTVTHLFECVPVEDIIIGEALSVEQVSTQTFLSIFLTNSDSTSRQELGQVVSWIRIPPGTMQDNPVEDFNHFSSMKI